MNNSNQKWFECEDELKFLRAENSQLKIDLSLQEKATQVEAEEVERLKAQLAERDGECCSNCKYRDESAKTTNSNLVICNFKWTKHSSFTVPCIAWCPKYTAKPKVRKCRWVMKKMGTDEYWITKDKYSPEDEFILKNSELVVGPVEGTWEEE